MKWSILFALVRLAEFGSADVLDMGEIDQYNSRVTSTPELSGNTVWISGKEAPGGDGIDIVLSQDAQANVDGILEGCGQTDNKCYQDVYNTLQSANLELDHKLDRRAFIHLLSKTVSSAYSIFASMAAYLLFDWNLRAGERDHSAIFLPQTIASEAAKLVSATDVVLSGGGSAIATITPTPDPTTLTGSVAPSVTVVTSAGNGFSKGDLVAILDKDMAARIDEIMHRMVDCEDGRKFDSEQSLNKRAADVTKYAPAICAAEGVAGMATPGGPFGDLLLLKHDQMAFGFADAAGKAKDALVVVKDFVLAYAPMLTIPEDLADQLATYLFALAIETVIEGVTLTEKNRIEASLVVTGSLLPSPVSTTTSSTSSCPDPEKTPLRCGFEEGSDCSVLLPERVEEGIFCEDGKYKSCECYAPTLRFDRYVSVEEAEGIQMSFKLFEELKNHDKTHCSSDWSEVQLKYWNTVYPRFCDEIKAKPEDELARSYKNSDIQSRKRSSPIEARTPPVDPSDYEGLQFTFEWSGGKNCRTSCEDAFYHMGQGYCGGSANVMKTSGSVDIGCGRYSYRIEEQPIRNATIACRNHVLSAPKYDTSANGGTSVEKAISTWCTDNDGKTVVKSADTGKVNIYGRWDVTQLDVPRRQSFWLRATLNGCGESAMMVRAECIKALTDGMEQCDKESPVTHGHAASIDCLDYSIDLSGVTRDDSPPWDQKPSFPPSELEPRKGGGPNEPICLGGGAGRPISDYDLNRAIDAFCKDGQEIKGFGRYWENMFNYPPKDEPQFYPDDPMHLAIGVETINNGAAEPYENMDWCKNYDWKMGREDCTYALRKLYGACSHEHGFDGGDYTYRCVHYNSWHVNG